MKVELRNPAEIDADFRDAWRELESRAATPANPFFCCWFLEPALVRLAPPQTIRLLTITGDKGSLLGLAPVERGETYARIPLRHFATWRHPHAYNSAPLCAAGAEPETYAAILDWIDTRPEDARFIRFNEHPLHGGVLAISRLHGRSTAFEIETERAILSGGESFETVYADGFSGKKRKELRRQWRRLGETGALVFERHTAPGEIARTADDFIALELAGWKGRTAGVAPVGATEAEAAFFREAMTRGAAEGAVLCDVAAFDGRPIAILFSLRCGATLSAYKIVYDEAFSAYSPGVHVLVEAMRLMLDDPGIKLFDSCARAGHPVADHLWRERMRVAHFNVSGSSFADRTLFGAAARLSAFRKSGNAPKENARNTKETADGGAID